ncbi:MAG: hypothetical protein LV479_08355 [Methylacidiphilales bacterium]|nr:hypothetical protein [Candidatus Methylacidiphilales bacterium]
MSTPLAFEENATPVIRGVARSVNSRGAAQAVGIGMRRVVRTYLRDLDQYRPTKHAADLPGSQSTHYYEQAAESITAPEVAGNRVTISITQVGFRQRLLGGQINPVNAKFLTIPGMAATYGTRAGEFQGLKFAYAQDVNGNLHPALVTEEAFQLRGTVRNRRGMGPKPAFQAGSVAYWLYRSVNQNPDPGVLPGEDYITAGAVEGLRSYLRLPRVKYGEAQ